MNFGSCIKIPTSKDDLASGDKALSFQENGVNLFNNLLVIANEVFGHGRWSHSVTNQTVDFVEYVMGKYHIGCAAFVRVQLADGTFHEEMGYSNSQSSMKGSAVHSARSSSITNAFKKALLCFGGIIEDKINAISPIEPKRRLKKTDSEESFADKSKTESCKLVRSTSTHTPKRMKSPNTVEIEGDLADGEAAGKKEEPKIAPGVLIQITKQSENTAASREEELRMERKRKQKEKQEEYRRLMLNERLKNDEKPNPKY